MAINISPMSASELLLWLEQVAKDNSIPPCALRAAVVFFKRFAAGNSSVPGMQRKIAQDLDASPATIHRAVTALVRNGHLLAVSSGHGRLLSYSPQIKAGG